MSNNKIYSNVLEQKFLKLETKYLEQEEKIIDEIIKSPDNKLPLNEEEFIGILKDQMLIENEMRDICREYRELPVKCDRSLKCMEKILIGHTYKKYI